MDKVNVYDFDGTIYDGDSSVDFFKFAAKRNKKLWGNVFPTMLMAGGYVLGLRSKEEFKSKFFKFVSKIENLDEAVDEFWAENEKKIKSFYKTRRKKTDYIISASPEFLLLPLAEKWQVHLIATGVDTKTGKLTTRNCHGREKVKRFSKTGKKIGQFYSDSLADRSLAEIADEAFLVKGEEIRLWPKRDN